MNSYLYYTAKPVVQSTGAKTRIKYELEGQERIAYAVPFNDHTSYRIVTGIDNGKRISSDNIKTIDL